MVTLSGTLSSAALNPSNGYPLRYIAQHVEPSRTHAAMAWVQRVHRSPVVANGEEHGI
jgi:hypothetical protein